MIRFELEFALGNLYASQLFEAAERDLGQLDQQFTRGEFTPLRNWLLDKVHRHGRCYSAQELIQSVTGEPLSSVHLLKHLRGKYLEIYKT